MCDEQNESVALSVPYLPRYRSIIPFSVAAATASFYPVIRRPFGAEGGGPDCVTVTVVPPIVNVAARDAPVVFADAVAVTVPLPDPFAPLITVSHDALLVAVQPQPVAAVTVSAALPPATTMLEVVGETVNVHVMPGCTTVTAFPAAVSVALLEVVVVLAVAVTLTVPLPDPLAPLITVVQPQPAPAVTATLDAPPPTATFTLVGDTEKLHGAE
jgi:hypothetical protein